MHMILRVNVMMLAKIGFVKLTIKFALNDKEMSEDIKAFLESITKLNN